MGSRGRAGRLPYGSLFQTKSGIYRWRYYDLDGLRREKSTETTDEAEATRIATRWAVEELAKREGLIRTSRAGLQVTLGDAAADYFSRSEAEDAAGTLEMKAIHIEKKIFPLIPGETKLQEISVQAITQFRNALSAGGLSAQYINKILSTLSGILKHSVENGWLEAVPYIRRLPEDAAEHGYVLNDAEIGRLVAAARETSPRVGLPFVALGLYCGLRHSEILGLTWEGVEFWEVPEGERLDHAVVGLIHLARQKNRKSKAPRPLLLEARDILWEVPVVERIGHVIQWRGSPVQKVRKIWDTIVREAGLDEIRKRDGRRLTPHDLRHTFTTRWFAVLGYDARLFSGHSSQEAFIRYLHAERDRVFREARNPFRKGN